MNLSILIGIQGARKSTFAAQQFAHTHLRLSRDVLKSENRLMVLFHAALSVGAPILLDNTNPGRRSRARFIQSARAAGYSVHGYHVDTPVETALERNAQRSGKARVPDKAVLGTAAKVEQPSLEEGFDAIHQVISSDGEFEIRRVESTNG